MTRKLFLLLLGIFTTFSAIADEWGCDNITAEEMEKAKSVLKAAQEIVLLDHLKTKVIKFDDIVYKEEFGENYEYRSFGVDGRQLSARDLFVRFAENTKYLNLGLFIGCEFTSVFDVKEIKEDGNVEVKHSLENAKKIYDKCSVQDFSDGKEVDIDSPDILTDIISKEIDCYKAALFEFFDTVHPVYSYKYKKAFDDFIASYKMVRTNVYFIQDGYFPDIYFENRAASKVLDHVKQIVKDYFDEYER